MAMIDFEAPCKTTTCTREARDAMGSVRPVLHRRWQVSFTSPESSHPPNTRSAFKKQAGGFKEGAEVADELEPLSLGVGVEVVGGSAKLD